MNNTYNLNSILDAIEEINSNKKIKSTSFVSNNANKIKKIVQVNEEILPITEKLILEAEEHSKKAKKKL